MAFDGQMAFDLAPSFADKLPLAFDRESVRSKDVDGRLHVKTANISKATVNPYRGDEIPGWKELGLDANRVYQLYRDPAELAKAAASFNHLPILSSHVPVNADEPRQDLVIGTTGTEAAFTAPYLRNSLAFWDGSAIDAIEAEDGTPDQAKELSCAYRYVPVMVAGKTPDGQAFDGTMTAIVGNHIALVKSGRAGSDVVVGDAKPVAIAWAFDAFATPRLAYDFSPFARDAEFEESKHPRADNGQFGTGTSSSGKPNSPHERSGANFEHAGEHDLAAGGLKPKLRGNGANSTEAAQVAWGHAQRTGQHATAQPTGRGFAVLRSGERVPGGTQHMVVTPEGMVHQYKPKMPTAEEIEAEAKAAGEVEHGGLIFQPQDTSGGKSYRTRTSHGDYTIKPAGNAHHASYNEEGSETHVDVDPGYFKTPEEAMKAIAAHHKAKYR